MIWFEVINRVVNFMAILVGVVVLYVVVRCMVVVYLRDRAWKRGMAEKDGIGWASAYQEGYDARFYGYALMLNPYKQGSPEGKAWREGYADRDSWEVENN